jgi:hypothetical protein
MSKFDFVNSLMLEISEYQTEKNQIMPQNSDEDELSSSLIKHWLNFAIYYERAATNFIGVWMQTTTELDAFVNFAHQIEDEANHYSWLCKFTKEYSINLAEFKPPEIWRYLMEDYYPGLEYLVERLAAHNIVSEIGALGFMEFNQNKFPKHVRRTVEKICYDERYHVSFGKQLLAKYCTTSDLQDKARNSSFAALEIMKDAREVFVNV